MAKKTPITLNSFFVFNSLFGPREGEEEKKILYYYPPLVDIDKKIKDVGLSEAITRFSSTFSDDDVETFHTQRTRQLYFQPEPNYWLVLVVNVPCTQRVRDEDTVVEYHEDQVQDSVFKSVIRHMFNMYKLFNGSMEATVAQGTVQTLKQCLDHFYTNYLSTLKLPQSDILSVFNGIQLMGLNRKSYLRIQSFINLLESTFPQITHTAFLFSDQLVWSGLELEDMRTLYSYLTNSLFPDQLKQDFQESVVLSSSSGKHYGRFILGPPNISNEKDKGKIPKVYVETETGHRMCHLLVYRALSATTCVLIDGKEDMNFALLRKLDGFLGPNTSRLASDMGEQYSKRPASGGEPQFKYVYFNHMNLAQKSTIHKESNRSPNVPQDVLRILADLNHDLHGCTSVEEGETIVKTQSDCWVMGKKSDKREFYVVINQKNANLIDVNDEAKRLCSSQFNNMFFLE